MERLPLELESPAHLEYYGPAHPPSRPRERRQHLTPNERTASKVLFALLAGLYLVGLLALAGVPGLKPLATLLALASLATAGLLLLILQSDGVSERLFFVDLPAAQPARSKRRVTVAIMLLALVVVVLVLLLASVPQGVAGPAAQLILGAFFVGRLALIESRRPTADSPAHHRFVPRPATPAYTPRSIPPIRIALFILLGFVVATAWTAFQWWRPALDWAPH